MSQPRHLILRLAAACIVLSAPHAFAQERLYLYGTAGGCLVQLDQPLKAEESLRWEGQCAEEFAEGEGTLSVLAGTAVVRSTSGAMVRGRLPGTAPAPLPATPAQAGPVLVDFALASASLDDQARQILTEAGARIKDESVVYKVLGHADASGTPKSNARLSRQRADAVRAFLIASGVPADRLLAEGRAERDAVGRRVSLEAQP